MSRAAPASRHPIPVPPPKPVWRPVFGRLHRWLGLATALFLIVSGLTGAVITWDHEIDEWLNADLFESPGRGPMRHPLELVAAIETADPRAAVSYATLQNIEGEASGFFVRPRIDPASGRPYRLDYNQVYVDPVTAAIQGRRDSLSVSLSTRNLMPFLHRLHYTLQLPTFWGIDRWGQWLMGGVALIWLVDSFIGLYLTLPPRSRLPHARGESRRFFERWKPAWLIRLRGGYKLNFDLHRAFGLWTWLLIIIIAFTSFSINLRAEVFYPMMSLFSKVSPSVNEQRVPVPLGEQIVPDFTFAQIIERAGAEAKARGWTTPMGGIYYNHRLGLYNVSFFDRGNEHGNDGMGLSNLYYDGRDGTVLGETRPWHGTAADVFMQLQLPLHSGRIIGLPGQILMSVMGAVVAMLSITGIVIWARKARARAHRERASAASGGSRPTGTHAIRETTSGATAASGTAAGGTAAGGTAAGGTAAGGTAAGGAATSAR